MLIYISSASAVVFQRCLPSAPQRDAAAFCNEENQQAEPYLAESDPAGFCREGHPHFCRKPLRRLHVLLL